VVKLGREFFDPDQNKYYQFGLFDLF